MPKLNPTTVILMGVTAFHLAMPSSGHGRERVEAVQIQAQQWRAEHRLIDTHQHVGFTKQHLTRAVKIMDAVGIGLAVNLGTGSVTPGQDGISEFERNKRLADALFPGRFLHTMLLDYRGWDEPDFAVRAARQIQEGHRLGAVGLKEFKRFGLTLRDGQGRLIQIDDPKLDLMWARCGELGMPVFIHVADPKAFWDPYNEKNERWKELRDHPGWWFGDTNKYPPRMALLEALNRVVARHPGTTFVGVHFANNAEDLDWVERSLDKYPNLMADLAARIPELGRHSPAKLRRLFIKHQDRILFGTDFMVYDRLILGSSGKEPPPTDVDAEVFFAKHWRWLETRDRNWPHMTPIQGDWTISAIGLPTAVLRKIYFDNARKLLARYLPAPRVRAARIETDFAIDGTLQHPAWQRAAPARIEYLTRDYAARPELSTEVRLLWSPNYLYLGYRCPYTRLTVFEPPQFDRKRFDLSRPGVSLWDRDVVEAFIAPDPQNVRRYAEFEVAPTSERLDLWLDLPAKDFAWNSGFQSATRISQRPRVWTSEMRIPLRALSPSSPQVGTHWRLNLLRCDYGNKAFLAWSPTLRGSFHVPEKFGILEFGD
jgi:predicted TIM-barrel fold metal-dependent hydrolase